MPDGYPRPVDEALELLAVFDQVPLRRAYVCVFGLCPIVVLKTKMFTPEQKAAKRAKFEGAFAKIREELLGGGMPEEGVVRFEDVKNPDRFYLNNSLCHTSTLLKVKECV